MISLPVLEREALASEPVPWTAEDELAYWERRCAEHALYEQSVQPKLHCQ